MTTTIPTSSGLAGQLARPLAVGPPDVCGPLAVFPLFGADPGLEYRSFAEAMSLGARVTELPGGASVNDLLVHNPCPVPVLLYEGEELLGAQQNRTVDCAVLVAARSDLRVAVSCVEQHRWDGGRHGEAFTPSIQAAYPALRAAKNRAMRRNLAVGLPARADQGEVWREVAGKADELGEHSPTEAMDDVYRARDAELGVLQDAIERHDGQVGAIVAIGGEFVVVDHVSRADVFAALHGPLVRGYALDAISRPLAAPAPAVTEAEAFLAAALSAPFTVRASAGMGEAASFAGGAASGTALLVDGELIQCSAYAGGDDDGSGATPGAGRIRRPSRRR